MKKFLSVILCSVLVFTLAACGKTEVKTTSTKGQVKQEPKVVTKVETPVVTTVVPKVTPIVKNENKIGRAHV